jgi:hypothetical protein
MKVTSPPRKKGFCFWLTESSLFENHFFETLRMQLFHRIGHVNQDPVVLATRENLDACVKQKGKKLFPNCPQCIKDGRHRQASSGLKSRFFHVFGGLANRCLECSETLPNLQALAVHSRAKPTCKAAAASRLLSNSPKGFAEWLVRWALDSA